MEVIVLDDSDEGDIPRKHRLDTSSFIGDGSSRPRLAKRRRPDASLTHVSDTADLTEDASHVSDTVLEPSATEAPITAAAAPSSDAESPALSSQQVVSLVGTYNPHLNPAAQSAIVLMLPVNAAARG